MILGENFHMRKDIAIYLRARLSRKNKTRNLIFTDLMKDFIQNIFLISIKLDNSSVSLDLFIL